MSEKPLIPPTPHPEIARELKASNELIIKNWEVEVRKKVIHAQSLPRLILRDSLPEFINRLADTLSAVDKIATLKEAGEVGKKHGEDRAFQSNYNVSEVLIEYWILRSVIFETLERDKPIPVTARDLVLIAVDEGIRCAVEEFAEDRTRMLEQSNRDLEHFAAVAAHDLKSPLSTISGYLEVIQEGVENKVDEDLIGYIKTTKRAAAQMSVMIDRLLDYSSVGKQNIPFAKVDMREVVEEAERNLKSAIQKSKAQFMIGILPTVMGESSLLVMLMQNLLSNAIKFRDENIPEIAISAEQKGHFWIFAVKDNGIGFEPKQAENIFAIFKQFHQPQKYQGFGIGLATARKVVELHGGQIWAESKPGVGSTFYFSLPVT